MRVPAAPEAVDGGLCGVEPIGVARALADCRSFLMGCTTPPRVYPIDDPGAAGNVACGAAFQAHMRALCGALDVSPPAFCAARPADATSLDVGLSRFLAFAGLAWGAPQKVDAPADVLARRVRIADDGLRARSVATARGPALKACACGPTSDHAVVLVPPCGVPMAALRPWMTALGRNRLTITWESPSMFGADPLPPVGGDPVHAIATEITELVRAYGLARVHLVGICGGAAPAMLAAAELAGRVDSLSICHGDVKVGEAGPRTPFQEQFHAMLDQARDDEAEARDIYSTMLDPGFALSVPARLGPFVLYPYTRLSLFCRYALVNSALMNFDAAPLTADLACPVLVLTSRTDRMAHPEPSRLLASLLPRAHLHEREAGDHLDVLLDDPEVLGAVTGFMSMTSPAPVLAPTHN